MTTKTITRKVPVNAASLASATMALYGATKDHGLRLTKTPDWTVEPLRPDTEAAVTVTSDPLEDRVTFVFTATVERTATK